MEFGLKKVCQKSDVSSLFQCSSTRLMGKRNEDRFSIVHEKQPICELVGAFGLFDGNGGYEGSSLCAQEFSQQIMSTFANLMNQHNSRHKSGANFRSMSNEDICDALLCESIRFVCESMSTKIEYLSSFAGSSAVAIFLRVLKCGKSKVYCVNLGDSRIAMFKDSQSLFITEDHNLKSPRELERVVSGKWPIFSPLPLPQFPQGTRSRPVVDGHNATRLSNAKSLVEWIVQRPEVDDDESAGGGNEESSIVNAYYLCISPANLEDATTPKTGRRWVSFEKLVEKIASIRESSVLLDMGSVAGQTWFRSTSTLHSIFNEAVQLLALQAFSVLNAEQVTFFVHDPTDVTRPLHSWHIIAKDINASTLLQHMGLAAEIIHKFQQSVPIGRDLKQGGGRNGMGNDHELDEECKEVEDPSMAPIVVDWQKSLLWQSIEEEAQETRETRGSAFLIASLPLVDPLHHSLIGVLQVVRAGIDDYDRIDKSRPLADPSLRALVAMSNAVGGYIAHLAEAREPVKLHHSSSFVAHRRSSTGQPGALALFSRHHISTPLTRTMGSRYAARSCAPVPDVTLVELEPGERARFVLATRRVWEALSLEQVSSIVGNSKGSDMWSRLESGKRSDVGLAVDTLMASDRIVETAFIASKGRRGRRRGSTTRDISAMVLDVSSMPPDASTGPRARDEIHLTQLPTDDGDIDLFNASFANTARQHTPFSRSHRNGDYLSQDPEGAVSIHCSNCSIS